MKEHIYLISYLFVFQKSPRSLEQLLLGLKILLRLKLLPRLKILLTSKTQNMTKLLKFWVNDTRKVHPDDDDEAIPWIAASKSSNQKDFKHTPFYLI